MRAAVIFLLLCCLVFASAPASALPDDLAGSWAGSVRGDTGDGSARVVVSSERTGFDLQMVLPEMPPYRVRLVPSSQPDVFEPVATGGGLFAFFTGGDRSDPFGGEPLLWARQTEQGLVAYRLLIRPDGGVDLLRVAMERTDQGLDIAVEQRRDTRQPRSWRGLLRQQG